ncbi:MAG: GNAT family N-acetyltransferase [Lachnospiraceae bacterium]
MNIKVERITKEEVLEFKLDMQEAFQKGAEKEFPDLDTLVLPEEDIDRSLNANGAIAYKAIVNNEMVGGAIVVIDEKTQHNHLDFLYVKCGIQSNGVGQFIWNEIEQFHSNTKVWETVTPYFEKRNLHFYINRCGFHIVEFFNSRHKDPHMQDDTIGKECFFRFEKRMK